MESIEVYLTLANMKLYVKLTIMVGSYSPHSVPGPGPC